MSSTVLIQQASGPSRLMLEMTAARHAACCARHGITYWPVIGDVQWARAPRWNKIVLVRHALHLGFDTVAWLDADTLIVRDDEDLRTALNGGGPLGLAWHVSLDKDDSPPHWNAGVMIIRNTPCVRAFFDAVWSKGPLGENPLHEQARMMDLLPGFPGLVQRLDDRWNSTVGLTEVAHPVIKAWHRHGPKALTSIYAELKSIGAADARVLALASTFVQCDNAVERAAQFIENIPPFPDAFQGRGIVMGAGGRGYFPCAWVCLHQLRRLGCTLPVQLWHLGPHELDNRMRALVAPLGAKCVDALEVRQRHPARRLDGFELKPYAILHCPFREVLWLDADNLPVVNPEFLFDTPQFREAGALFWPDYHRMKPERSAWKFFDVPYRDEPEFESGQMVMDKERCWRALCLAMWYNEHSDFFYNHAHGDKDTFRFAWHRLGQKFRMAPFPIYNLEGTMGQHDFAGHRIFQHRNTDKWNLYRDNKHIAGFLFEDKCRADLVRLRTLWDGAIRPE